MFGIMMANDVLVTIPGIWYISYLTSYDYHWIEIENDDVQMIGKWQWHVTIRHINISNQSFNQSWFSEKWCAFDVL